MATADPCGEAAWDFGAEDCRKDLVEATRDLAPGVIRWGDILSRYYKWREGVGPVKSRPPMRNYAWGGKQTNRIGTHEFVDLCRRSYVSYYYGSRTHLALEKDAPLPRSIQPPEQGPVIYPVVCQPFADLLDSGVIQYSRDCVGDRFAFLHGRRLVALRISLEAGSGE